MEEKNRNRWYSADATIACQPYTLNQYFLMEFLANLSAVTTSFSPIKTGLATVAGAM